MDHYGDAINGFHSINIKSIAVEGERVMGLAKKIKNKLTSPATAK